MLVLDVFQHFEGEGPIDFTTAHRQMRTSEQDGKTAPWRGIQGQSSAKFLEKTTVDIQTESGGEMLGEQASLGPISTAEIEQGSPRF